MRTLALLSIGLLLGTSGVARAQDAPAPTLDSLLAGFKQSPGLFARFKEEKHMALLAKPLVNEGTLHFFPPGRVARHVTKPSKSTVLIDEGSIRMGDSERQETLSLKRSPVLRQFLDSFLKILSGDRPALEKSYRLVFKVLDPKVGRWQLALEPKLSPMKDAIERITFVGRGLVMDRLTILEVGGDKSVTTFSDVDPARVYGKAEQARLFAMPKRGSR
jgi:outer membrane lipoprotein-sorting protein